MATIGKITRANSGTRALNYALGKDQLSPETKTWLRENGVSSAIVDQLSDRAVVMDGWNVNPKFAVKQMSATRKAWQTQGKQVTRVIQSFPSSDLSAANPDAWVKANHMGVELAQKAFKDYQVAIYTHIDGVGHKIHNHLVINMPNLKTGKKYHAYRDWEKIAAISNAITQAHGYSVPHNQALERRTMAERQLANKQAYVWKDDLRQRIDAVMQDPSVSSFKTFSELLDAHGVIVHPRGKNVSYAFLDANNKQRRARGTTLGHDYEKEVLEHELEQRAQQSNFTFRLENVRGQQLLISEKQRKIAAEQQTITTTSDRTTDQRASLVRKSDVQLQADFGSLQTRKSKIRATLEQIERAIPRIIRRLRTQSTSLLDLFNQSQPSSQPKAQRIKKVKPSKSLLALLKQRSTPIKHHQQERGL